MNNDLYFCLHDEANMSHLWSCCQGGAEFQGEGALITSATLIMSAGMLSSAQESSGSSKQKIPVL